MKLHVQSHRVHVNNPRDVFMIAEENEYMPQDATDDSPKALGIATPANRTVHYTVAILGCADSQTSLPFRRMTM